MNALTSATGGPDDNDARAGHLVYVKSARSGAPAADGSLPPETWIEGGVSPTLNTFDNGDVRATVLAFSHTAGIDPQASTDGARSVLAGHDRMPAISGDAGVRRLTPVECERLQGFPDEWTEHRLTADHVLTPQADSSRYRQLGNAVAVPVAEWILTRLVEVDA